VEPGIVQTGSETVDVAEETRALGAGWVRMFVDWNKYEPAPGAYDAFEDRRFGERIAAATARGQRVLLVVVRSPRWASGSADADHPPRDPATYAAFLRRLAERFPAVAAYEVWNEPDEREYWAPVPDPAAYAALLNASHDAVKSVAPHAVVVSGGLVGNDYRFLEQVVDAGGTRFDAVGVHTDTACLTSPPEEQYREPDGRIGRFSFTGYREVRQSLLARSIDRPIWITEMGWSTLTSTCTVGGRAGTKPSGVPPAQQAKLLGRAYACLQRDPYVSHAFWFSLQDLGGEARYDHFLGLVSTSPARKPAWEAFRAFAQASPRPSANCGSEVDVRGPEVSILSPAPQTPFLDKVMVRATASDVQGVAGMELFVDGRKVGGKQKGGSFALEWNGARRLPVGVHTLTVRARDRAMNTGEASVAITRADPDTLQVPVPQLRFELRRAAGRRVVVSGAVHAPGAPVQPRGKVRMFFELRKTIERGGRRVQVWRPASRFTKDAKHAFRFSFRLRKPGTWRAFARYTGERPYKPLRTRYTVLRYVR
jgi:Bacterial Ig domain/Cellulase (glycosyl hydrolase family 5)